MRRASTSAPAATFGTLLKRLRRAAGLTQAGLAARAGYSTVYVGMLERGERAPVAETIAVLAAALHLTSDEQAALAAAGRRGAEPHSSLSEAGAAPGRYLPALPAPPTSFVGREHEVGAVTTLLQTAAGRLVTLTGPGGIGKTRLALRVAADMADCYADGVAFVALAPLATPALVLPTIAAAFGLHEVAGRPLLETLIDYLRDRQSLLVLDNFEHVLEAAPLVAELLSACPSLDVLVTTRMPLRLQAEQEFAVPPLGLPAADAPATRGSLGGVAAPMLFVQRARQALPTFALTDANAPAVAAVCRRLDGVPLAIELAAARIKALTPGALLALLDEGAAGGGRPLDVLTGGARDLPARQRSMRATIAWSHDLLGPGERILFRRLAVFAGGWTLGAATAVDAALGTGSPLNGGVLERLVALVDASLVTHEGSAPDQGRYSMLETIRAFALDRLEESGERDEARSAHLRYYLQHAASLAAPMSSGVAPSWVAQIELDLENYRTSLQWAAESRAHAPGLELATALASFWHWRGYFAEGWAWLDLFLRSSAEGEIEPRVRCKALNCAGALAYRRGDLAAADISMREGLALARRLGDQGLVTDLLHNSGLVAKEQRDYERAVALFEESMALDRARGNQRGVVTALANLGWVAHARGDYVGAAALAEECLALCRPLGDIFLEATVLGNLAHAACALGDDERAAALYRRTLTTARDLGVQWGVPICLEGLARVAAHQGRLDQAARWWGCAAALREAIGAPLSEDDRLAYDYDRSIDGARTRLGDTRFTEAWAEGQSLSMEQAIAEALDAGDPAAVRSR